MRALGASCKESIVPKLGDVLVFALGGRVVDRNFGMVDEAKKRIPMGSIIANDLREVIVWREPRLDSIHPLQKLFLNRRDLLSPPCAQRIARQSGVTRLFFHSIDGGDKVSAFGR